jgi:hypothetical protein
MGPSRERQDLTNRWSQPLAGVLKGRRINMKDEVKAKLAIASGSSARSR